MSNATVRELNLPGLKCPMPVLRAKKMLATMKAGEKLRVISTDPHSLPDLAEFCRQTGHQLLEQHDDAAAATFTSIIARRAD